MSGVIDMKFMKSRVHSKEKLQMFPAVLEIPNFLRSFKILENKSYCILGSTFIKAKTNFRDDLPKPHPRIFVETLIFWSWNLRTITFSVKLREIENLSPHVRFCLETYVMEGDDLKKAKWAHGFYFGDNVNMAGLVNEPFTMWTWGLDPKTLNMTCNGAPIGNLRNYLFDGTLKIRLELLAMSTRNVIGRVIHDHLRCGMKARPLYTELLGNRYRGPLQMLYKEFGDYTICIYSGDRRSYFLCHKLVLFDSSSVLRAKFAEMDHEGRPVRMVKLSTVSTAALRNIIYKLYHNRLARGWNNVGLEVLGGCINLKMYELLEEFVKKLKETYNVPPETMAVLWESVHRYCILTNYNAAVNVRISHANMHPGVPCGEHCGNV